ncbi:nicotinate (nicotinamide) nucleotide adenylyltransferase [Oxynema sp. CENA135]|uniref:nicotinate (nicotinamide) nucleotide adenylyltransferase n=1 Tax=Oxynema sp. CENA135 TaxID=984206 RepID=UPI00190D7A39|nr:nicotinate (nicotinamide) nucleotide adenylyltransferase [Oxynema sp. CENA135]MBK4732759.1 nicotinate (nicotinamide) nucleotide adenylyltransferase [Oxynema sp. CENA135]
MQKIGIFGGTFDPVHRGHAIVAEAALTQAQLDVVLWLPDRRPPHPLKVSPSAYEHRCKMVELAIADRPEFALFCDPNGSSASHSYAINTFLTLCRTYPDTRWSWILGADAFAKLPKWYRARDLVDACRWLVAPRPLVRDRAENFPDPTTDLAERVAAEFSRLGLTLHWQILDLPGIAVSSTAIRRSRRQGNWPCESLADAVRIYIESQNLYRH